MNVKFFAASLAASLIDRGIDADTAKSHVLNLTHSLTEEDLAEISAYSSADDFATLSDSLASLIKEKREKAEEARRAAEAAYAERENQKTRVVIPETVEGAPLTADSMKTQAVNLESIKAAEEASDTADMMKTRVGERAVTSEQEIYLAGDGNDAQVYVPPEIEKVRLTPRGAAFFWIIGILTLPLTAGFALAIFSIFAVGFLAVCILIGASFALVAAEVVAGTGAALVGIIYGIIQIFTSSAGIGLFEMGLGIIFAGAALLLGVLTYNFAVLVLPYVLRQLASLFRRFVGQIKSSLRRFREECNRL